MSKKYEVHIISPGDCPDILKNNGFVFHSLDLSRIGMNPVLEIASIFSLYRLFVTIKPDLVHLVTIKPYLYGGIAARIARIAAVVSAVPGLGTIFIDNSFKYKVIRSFLWILYKLAFGHKNQKIIFQNTSDIVTLSNLVSFSNKKSILIRGSGVDLEKYKVQKEQNNVPVVSLVARLLKDKGVIEFVEASKILKKRNIQARMCLVGDIDTNNKTSISKFEIDSWTDLGLIEWWGYQEDIATVYAQSNIACLPSYREGLPKSLIEAAACGRSVITTDVPGCRDAIEPGVSGILVPVKDETSLADAIEELIKNPHKRNLMGKAGRNLAENAFDIKNVINAHLKIYEELL